MSLAKQLDYQETPVKNKISATQVALRDLSRVSTTSILWYLVKRHKTVILATWAVGMTILYLFPPAPAMLLSLLT